MNTDSVLRYTMSQEDSTAVRGIEMSDAEIEAFLEAQGHGVLALANDGASYAVPVSFGYDGERLYVHLIRFGDSGEKFAYVDGTERACLTAYDVDSRFEWRSVVVRGPLRAVPDSETDHMEAVIEENAWIPSLFPPTSPMTGVERFELATEEASGRKGEAYQ